MKKEIAKYQKAAFAYAKTIGFNRCLFEKEWKGYMAFHVWHKKLEGACVGYPQFVLVDNDMTARMATLEELFDGLFFDNSKSTPQIDFSSHEALDAWIEKYGDKE
ncbi:hypothetical protein [uncultured Bacteroides sp.]|uniref:hypothetical protein n=1 Tax=uncultured Bacteroides sp. TaxID=162156 RepID=UPI00261D778B|nr:hypothetical protein [uncultured Bacteroides sp.]